MTKSTTELLQIGLEATTFVLIRQMLSVAFEAVEVFWPVCGSYSPCADIWTPSRPPHRHGKPGDFGSLFFFFGAFSGFSKILGATFEKNTNFAMRLSRQAHDREIKLNLPSPFWGAPRTVVKPRASSPLFFIGGTQHPLSQRTNQYNVRSEWHWFVRCDLQIFSGCVCHLEQLHAQSPFLFPIVFSINFSLYFHGKLSDRMFQVGSSKNAKNRYIVVRGRLKS